MTLSEVCELIVDCPHSTAKDEGEGYPLIRTPNIGKGRLLLDGVHRVSLATYDIRNKRAVPQEDDLILAREAPVGNVAVVKENQIVCLGQRTVLIRPNKRLVDSDYLAYFLLSPIMQHILLTSSNGATVSHLNMSAIRGLEIDLPAIEKQRKIAGVLSKLADKIEINEQINRNLRDQQKTMVMEFLLNEDTPTRLLQEISTIKYGKGLPTKNLIEDGYPVFGGNGIIGYYDEFLYEKPQILISCRGAASGNILESLPFSFVTSNSLVVELEDYSYFEFLKQYLIMNPLYGYATGSAQPQITIDNIKNVEIPYPNGDDIQELSNRLQDLSKYILLVTKENENLAQTRDSLLPKLMSGELDISDLDI